MRRSGFACTRRERQRIRNHGQLLGGLGNALKGWSQNTMKQFEQQPDIGFPEWLELLGFEDASYSNDLAARASRRLNTFHDVLCWVNFANPDDRECGSESNLFHVETVPKCSVDTIEELYAGDDATEAERIILDLIAKQPPVIHEKDSDCTVNPDTQTCSVCFVDHSRECPDCHQRGFHLSACFIWEPPERGVLTEGK